MILDTNVRPIERSTAFEETEFKVAATAAVMKLLRSAIYSDKETALLRELSANAYDAHVDAGKKEVPISIMLPNYLEPTLKIRDFGKSMDHNTVMTLYATYGISTKGNSNEMIGAMGIGKFAAFAYSPSFQLSCIQDGKKRIYNLYLDESERGRMALLAECDTDEETGTEVSVPIQQSHIITFLGKASKLFQFWTPKPIITGNQDYIPVAPEYILEGDKWAIRKQDFILGTYSYVVMGGIPYRLDSSGINGLSNIGQTIINRSVVLFCNIGDVEVAASRETLGYTTKTINWVKAKIAEIESSIRKEVDEKIEKLSSEYEARKLYHSIFLEKGDLNIVQQILKNNITIRFNGKDITSASFRFPKTCKGGRHYTVGLRTGRDYVERTKVMQVEAYFNFLTFEDITAKDSKVRFFYDLNKTSKGKMRNLVRHYLTEKQIRKDDGVYVLQVPSEEYLRFWCFENGINFKLFKNLHREIVLPPRPKAPRDLSNQPDEYCNCRVYDPNEVIESDFRREDFSYTNIDLDEEEGGYYMVREGKRFKYAMSAEETIGVEYINDLWDYLNKFDAEFKEEPVIYTFTPRTAKKLGVNWKRIDEAFKTLIPVYWAKVTSGKKLGSSKMDFDGRFLKLVDMVNEQTIAPCNQMKELMETVDWENTRIDLHESFASKFGLIYSLAIDETGEISKLNKISEEVLDKVPLIRYIEKYHYDEPPVIDYIKKNLI